MNQLDELKLLEQIILKYNLPMSPILKYAINERCEVLANHSSIKECVTENEVIRRIHEQIQSIIFGYNSPLSLLIEYNPNRSLVVKKQELKTMLEDALDVQDEESNVILTHTIDWSPFEYGFTIDKCYHEAIFAAVGKYIPKGTGIDVKIVYDDKVFEAKITNANCQGRMGDTIRLLYKGKNNTLGSFFKEIMPETYNYIKVFKEKNGGRKQCPLPSNLRKLLVLKQTELSNTFNLFIEAC